ncbi:hypothetical protein ACOSQ3_004837 [Xanthoceras sorbifolium]
MSSSSNQRRCEGRREEASASGLQGVELPHEGSLRTITVAQVAASEQEDVEIVNVGPSPNVAGTRKKGKGVDFYASAEQPVQKGIPTHSAVVGQVALPSSSRGLGPVVKEYLKRAPTLYE